MTSRWARDVPLHLLVLFGLLVSCKGNFPNRDAEPSDAAVDQDVPGQGDADRESRDAEDEEICERRCEGRQCGDDGCGGICPPGCDPDQACSIDWQCRSVSHWTWVPVPAGTFDVGSPVDEQGRYDNENRHSVTLTRDFFILSTEVIQGDFEALMGYNPSSFITCSLDCPVETVTWHEAAAYCNVLSDSEGLSRCYRCDGLGRDVMCAASPEHDSPYDCVGYRLPTEAEWEYAARARTAMATYNGGLAPDTLGCEQPNAVLDTIAWFCGNSGETPHPVARLEPNPWGIYDMLGNVYEWVHDYLADYPTTSAIDPWGPREGGHRVVRGGSWNFWACESRAANRGWTDGGPGERLSHVGFRVARTNHP